jgi:hypothetical protein
MLNMPLRIAACLKSTGAGDENRARILSLAIEWSTLLPGESCPRGMWISNRTWVCHEGSSTFVGASNVQNLTENIDLNDAPRRWW